MFISDNILFTNPTLFTTNLLIVINSVLNRWYYKTSRIFQWILWFIFAEKIDLCHAIIICAFFLITFLMIINLKSICVWNLQLYNLLSLTSEATLSATQFFKRSYKISLDYKRPCMLCLALQPGQKLGLILVEKWF